MTRVISPAPQFTGLAEAEVMAALNDPDPGNPIACEVARLIKGYTENFHTHVKRLGYIPDSILHVKPQTAIEATAMRLTTETIQDQLSRMVPLQKGSMLVKKRFRASRPLIQYALLEPKGYLHVANVESI